MLKSSFYILNIVLIFFYLYPGSILGCYFYNDCNLTPSITKDIFIISSNHIYVFFIFSIIGILSFSKSLYKILFYLFFLSILLEIMHIIIPNRSFQVGDLLGNILGVIFSFIIFKLFTLRRFR